MNCQLLTSRRLLAALIIILHHALILLASTSTQNNRNNNKSNSNKDIERRHCDMEFCRTIVNRCKSLRKCSCKNKQDLLCVKGCSKCLKEKFGKCCPCVDICPPLKEDTHPSRVGNINETIYEELFDVLTETDDIHGRWSVETSLSSKEFQNPEYGRIGMRFDENNESHMSQDKSGMYESDDDNNGELDNRIGQKDKQKSCVVAFINKQLSMSQCMRYCESMGASSFRWFHEGCCECAGKFCLHYGINKAKCLIEFD